MSRVFTSSAIRNALEDDELRQLVGDFTTYIGGAQIERFGRDALYDHPNSPRVVLTQQVRHIHLYDPGDPWRTDSPPFQKTSDHHLAYCTGAVDEHCYLLIAILSPGAHEQARQFSVMTKLGEIAERFRNQY